MHFIARVRIQEGFIKVMYVYTYHGDHDKTSCPCPLAKVLERIRDGPVSVEAEDEEVEDGRCAGRVVDADPELAEGHSEQPVLREDVDGADWHYDETHDKVGHSKTHDEHVAHLFHDTFKTHTYISHDYKLTI